MQVLDFVRAEIAALPLLAGFAISIAVLVGVPVLAKKVGFPAAVGLLVVGIALGPHALGFFEEERPIEDFFGELGVLLLMFSAGLEIDLPRFRAAQNRSIIFGILTTAFPLALGTLFGLAFDYALIPAIVIGSLLASHTLIALPTIADLGETRLEPIVVVAGGTILLDTLSLLVFAICVTVYATGFSATGLTIQIVEILVVVPLILVGLGSASAFLMRRLQNREDGQFLLLLGVMATAAWLAEYVNLPGIVGAFLAGLAVNRVAEHTTTKERLNFFGRALFIPSFFVVTGCLVDPAVFARALYDKLPLAMGMVATLVFGKWLAAAVAGRIFGYSRITRLTMWSLTLPQVAATLAATVVAYRTLDPAGHRLLDGMTLNAVLVLMLATSTLGPLLTERFAPRLLESYPEAAAGEQRS